TPGARRLASPSASQGEKALRAHRLLQRDALQDHPEVTRVPATAGMRARLLRCPHPDQRGARSCTQSRRLTTLLQTFCQTENSIGSSDPSANRCNLVAVVRPEVMTGWCRGSHHPARLTPPTSAGSPRGRYGPWRRSLTGGKSRG